MGVTVRVHRSHQRVLICALSSAICALALLSTSVVRAQERSATPSPIHLILDYGSGVEKHYNRIEWSEGITVLGAMEQARALPQPLGMRFDQRGQGEMAFIRSIDGLANQGSGKGDRNWVFRVNGETARRGCGVTLLDPGDVVRWTFATYNMGGLDETDG